MREAIAFLLLACACGAATWKGRAEDAGHSVTASGRMGIDPDASASAGARFTPGSAHDGKSFADLEGKAVSLAPGLRQAAERQNGGERIELVRATDHDVCVRVAFEATAPVVARLLDASGGLLAETHAATTSGALGDGGPVCIRKGDAVSAAADGAAARLTWIAWASP